MVLVPLVLTAALSLQAPRFEAAAFRLSSSMDGTGPPVFSITTPGRVDITKAGLRFLVGSAYRISDSRVSLAQNWMNSVRYDLHAIYPAALSRDDMRDMLKTLLAERLQLQASVTKKQASGYALVVHRRGTRLAPAHQDEHGGERGANGLISGALSLVDLADILSRYLGSQVWDMTELKGRYDVSVRWEATGDVVSDAPALFKALVEQLGLELRPHKGMLDYLVVESALKEPLDN